MLTLKQAADETGRSKVALLKAIQKGTISAKKDAMGRWEIDPAELFRVYKRKEVTDNRPVSESEQREPPERDGLAAELNALRARLELVEHERERERAQLVDQIEDLRRRLDAADEERRDKDRQLTALLTDQRQPRAEPKRRGFFQLFGKRG